jgi:drug/metabolite transporter (DMT)-like permease
MSVQRTALLQMHCCVVLWGVTAVLGKSITLPAWSLVWWRMVIVSVTAMLIPAVWRGLLQMSRRTVAVFASIGIVIALHWLAFFGAIKAANASVAVSCLAVAPVFTALLEPLLTRSRFHWRDLLIGIAAIPGVLLVVGGTPSGMRGGLAAGLMSAGLAALFATLNKRHLQSADPLTVTAIELAAGTAFLTMIACWMPDVDSFPALPPWRDVWLLLVLALLCTLLPFVLVFRALRHISAFSCQLACSLEPVYAIGLAALLFNEQRDLDWRFYAGVLVILTAVLAQALSGSRAPSA